MAATIVLEDLDTYIGQYGPHGAIQRLQFVAMNAEGTATKAEALRLCLDMIKRTTNAKGYNEVYGQLKDLLQGGDSVLPHYDSGWVEATQKQVSLLKELYEQELHQARAQQMKEQARASHVQLASLCMEQGDYASAMKHASKSREYCTFQPQAVFSTCMTIINLCALLRQYPDIQSFASKAQHTTCRDEASQAQIHAAHGLYCMTCGKFKEAAGSFAQVKHQSLSQAFQDVLCSQDVALYGVLCAMAALSRTHVQEKFLAPPFRECLDLVPRIRDVALDFCSCKYAACLSALDGLRVSLALDVHMHGQVEELFQQIRSKCMVQYFTPFISVSLHSMAEAFNTDVGGIQAEVVELIRKQQLDAKIDSHKKVLHASHANQRRSTYRNAMRASQDFLSSTESLVLRMNLLKHDFGVHLARQKKS